MADVLWRDDIPPQVHQPPEPKSWLRVQWEDYCLSAYVEPWTTAWVTVFLTSAALGAFGLFAWFVIAVPFVALPLGIGVAAVGALVGYARRQYMKRRKIDR